MINQNKLIKALRQKRSDLQLTQTETANLIGISRQQLANIDKGKVNYLHVKTSDAIMRFLERKEF
ncbi:MULTISPECIES: transcriptional regulator [Leuconostoc]|uniref:transcriptional regulator n=1 Tax=Leuconostoc TaxID=1243 RepID=UPI000461EE76|nr:MULTISPECIES: transcriptional regulator [Leuconostoc]KDA48803.1 hypothetical protein L964_2022 [Leuconostoc pseudomesenteroides 1159]MCM6827036.1 transcriptional regulator [Leuconostoc mesenteroides]MCT4419858.1 transcriptional regulator [Leuconostoc falkenbergense]RDF90868.1 transcriptional regulator [Leuconostoc mesenteroides subsp. mesenteroides]